MNRDDQRRILREEVAGLIDTLRDAGGELERAADEVAAFASQRADHLALIAGEPGFGAAVRAEADNVALYAALKATDAADEADALRHRVFVEGVRAALSMAAKSIVLLA